MDTVVGNIAEEAAAEADRIAVEEAARDADEVSADEAAKDAAEDTAAGPPRRPARLLPRAPTVGLPGKLARPLPRKRWLMISLPPPQPWAPANI